MTQSSLPALGISRTLTAPPVGWSVSADVVVVGSGVAGLTCALRLRKRVPRVVLVTKSVLNSGSTVWAQGGVAAALATTDSPAAHLADTLTAGVGLCDEQAVNTLVTEGPQRVRELIGLGARFDTTPNGEISLTREGGHHADRIVHAGGDATGREISRALVAALRAVQDDPGIEVLEHAMVLDILTGPPDADGQGAVAGVTLHVIGEGARDGVGAVLAPHVVLATGGTGQLYLSTTNPREATGDGTAAALRAGARVADLEFVQFHPTVMWLGTGSRGQQPLISEAVRGEGALLLDVHGHRFMEGQHELAELAPRDVVAKAIVRQMAVTGADHVWLEARHLGRSFLRKRFPTIMKRLRDYGIAMEDDLIPVRPAQHYHSGGVVTDVDGRTNVRGLFAIGEAACTGVHGANRLASNSLLEGLVFGHRAAEVIAAEWDDVVRVEPQDRPGGTALVNAASRLAIQQAATDGPGVVRDRAGMLAAEATFRTIGEHAAPVMVPSGAEWETTNLHQIGLILNRCALLREETRGGHDRSDFPDRDDANWQVSQVARVGPDGVVDIERSARSVHLDQPQYT